ncbi:MAG: hypothetical protein CALGDGBN_01066 [Pseudomonadales bacterium]|nr:hypothetical protein [Pseudomonadales bacterium]
MFVAVYCWRVKPGREEQFREAWRTGTRAIVRIYGGLGSRLHRERDGRFVAIAEWPDEATWQRAIEARMAYDDPPTRARFLDALEDAAAGTVPVFTMEVTDDLLARSVAL